MEQTREKKKHNLIIQKREIFSHSIVFHSIYRPNNGIKWTSRIEAKFKCLSNDVTRIEKGIQYTEVREAIT